MDEEYLSRIEQLVLTLGEQHSQGGDDRILALGSMFMLAAIVCILMYVLRKVSDGAAIERKSSSAREVANRDMTSQLLHEQADLVREISTATSSSIEKLTDAMRVQSERTERGQQELTSAIRELHEDFRTTRNSSNNARGL